MGTVTGAVAADVTDSTSTYLDQVTTTVSHLPDAVDAYGSDADAFRSAADRLRTCESECDATLRELRTLLGESMPPNYTSVYLRVDDVVRLFDRLDAVPNRCEHFVDELDAMNPELPYDAHEYLREMASLVVDATAILRDATAAYVDSLLAEGESVHVTDRVEAIARLESECDETRSAAMADAFAACDPERALVVRALVCSLEDAMDAVEDAAEQLLSMNSGTL